MASQLRAERGDWLIIERAGVGQPPRTGLIVGVRSPGGAPPYVIRWGVGHTTLMFPGPDARVVPAAAVNGAKRARTRRPARPSRLRQWLSNLWGHEKPQER
ncbi:MAG: DUF1918 domain-containing protein [Actinophytocola sp.]|nr:DUF1918 domain-containing protein [Actinophytocola sp.]